MGKEIVVILSHLPWNFPTDYIKQTTLKLAKKAKMVVYAPLYPVTIRQFLFGKRSEVKAIDYILPLGLLPFQRFEFIRKTNVKLGVFLFWIIYRLKFGFQNPIFWGFDCHLAEALSFLKWGKMLIYDRVDEPASLDPEADKKLKAQDMEFIKKADIVFTNSPYGLAKIKKYHKRVFLVPCGCAVEMFSDTHPILPDELKHIPKPVIGLVGSIDHRLNFKILYPLVKKRSDWSFVFVGNPFSSQETQFEISHLEEWLAKLKKLPNVFFLGQKPKETLPDFIAGFDVCLIPYDVTQEFVKGCNPMKLYEYLAMGKPVVSTPIEALKVYSSVARIAAEAVGFERAIETFLKEDNDKQDEVKRKKIASANSWEKKIEAMWKQIS